MTASVADLLQNAATDLSASPSARLDAELLLAHVSGRNRAWLRAFGEQVIDPALQAQFMQLVRRRQAGEPVAYLTGMQEFWSLPLRVSPATLVPRPDTELLVEVALEAANADASLPVRVLDLGTGTGAVALAIRHERSQWWVTGVDRVPAAVQLARENAGALNLDVDFRVSDWFSDLAGEVFDVIVSNPPYIDESDSHLAGDGVRFEPVSALVAADAGLADIRRIVVAAPQHLVAGGLLALEHGYRQAADVARIMQAAGFGGVENRLDLAGNPRVTLGYLPLC